MTKFTMREVPLHPPDQAKLPQRLSGINNCFILPAKHAHSTFSDKMRLSLFLHLICPALAMLAPYASFSQSIELSDTERQWLQQHPVIRIAPDPSFAPFEWLDDQQHYQGITADYLKLIEQRTGIEFEIIAVSNWHQAIDLARERKIDVLPAVGITEQRQSYLLFSDTYQTVPGVVVSSRQYKNVQELTGHTVAVLRDSYWDDILSNIDTPIRIERVESIQFGIELATINAVDALVTDLASASYAVNESGISNLYIVNDPQKSLGNVTLSIGVRNDWPILVSILNRALNSISPEERQKIRSKWIHLKPPSWWLNRTFLIALAATLLVLALLFSGFYIWNRTLTRTVSKRTQQLHIAQQKLMQAEKMESIGRLAAGIAHEVKNPLAIIQMGMDYLTPDIPDDQNSRDVVKDINDAVKRADSVIHGLLDFSRDKKLAMSPGNINEVIESALHLVEYELHQRNIESKVSLASSLPAIELDSNKMQQVFINLFMNAAHAMEHNGTLIISSRLSQAPGNMHTENTHFNQGEEIICIEIADTGPGIRPQDKEKIFELFYTTKAIGEGTGLGLSVTRNIIQLHHGLIRIDNRPQGGAVVEILLKLHPQK